MWTVPPKGRTTVPPLADLVLATVAALVLMKERLRASPKGTVTVHLMAHWTVTLWVPPTEQRMACASVWLTGMPTELLTGMPTGVPTEIVSVRWLDQPRAERMVWWLGPMTARR